MRLAIISDIHEDSDRLQKILIKAGNIGYDKLICLGDISGFSLPYYKYGKERDASACLDMVREKCDVIIAGNHDLYAAGIAPDLPPELQGAEAWPHEQDLDPCYSESDMNFLGSLPTQAILNTPSMNILFTHYVFPNLSGYIKGFYMREKEFESHFAFMKEQNCSMGFTGHAHTRGFIKIQPGGIKQFGFRRIRISGSPSLIGIPPVTRNHHRSGFCIFDTDRLKLQALR